MAVIRIFLCLIIMLEIAVGQPATDPSEVVAIGKVIDHWNLQNKINLSIDPCVLNATWAIENANPRIRCDCSDSVCHITHIKMFALDISGELPQELFLLKELLDLNLDQNVLNGSIPPQIGQLSKLQYLSLGINNFTGRVPAELGNLSQLVSLSFSSNNFDGTLPRELGNLTSLQQLYIDSSGVSGPIPVELSSLTSLHNWWASDNRFTGKLPDFIGNFTELRVLRLEGTDLEGPIPSTYGKLTQLQDLRIGDLRSEDSSPDFLDNLTSLSILSLRNCRIIGQLPKSLSTFTDLKFLDLSFNKFTGPIPTSFQDFAALQYLYLGSNNLNGELPSNNLNKNLLALDVSFNPISGILPPNMLDISLNTLGTFINDDMLHNRKISEELDCFKANTTCKKGRSTTFSVNCGGKKQSSAADIVFDGDSEALGAASLYVNSNKQWAESSSGVFISNPNDPKYIARTDSQITDTLDSELYQSARKSPGSLRYYGLGLKNGKYKVEIHFSEIQMADTTMSWKGLGKRVFDVFIQGERVLQDFNIRDEAGGSNRALVKTFETNVSKTYIDIHFYWAGRGTCCIPSQSTYGPLVSAIHVIQESDTFGSSKDDKRRVGRIIGITVGCAAGIAVIASVSYLWWRSKGPELMRIHTHPARKL